MKIKSTNSKVRKTFFGSNTAHGYYSFFDFLTNLENARIFIVKGGPGTGKSTFIKTISEVMSKNGYHVELQFCSLDPASLDAVIVPEINAVVAAATGHHAKDPENPGVIDEIINLGDFWIRDGIRKYKKEILKINNASFHDFKKIYRYLGSADLIQQNIEDEYSINLNLGKLNQLTEKIIKSIFKKLKISPTVGRERHLFASAITSEGTICHINTLTNKEMKIIAISGGGIKTRSEVLKQIADEGKKRGCLIHYCHHPLNHYFIEHLILPEYNSFITSNCDLILNQTNCNVYNLHKCYYSTLQTASSFIESENLKCKALIDSAVKLLSKVKTTHLKLENYYTPNMNFNEVDKCRDQTIEKILLRAEKIAGKNSA